MTQITSLDMHIKEQLGHKILAMTVRYAHLIPNKRDDATKEIFKTSKFFSFCNKIVSLLKSDFLKCFGVFIYKGWGGLIQIVAFKALYYR
jgi:hypothetical protein